MRVRGRGESSPGKTRCGGQVEGRGLDADSGRGLAMIGSSVKRGRGLEPSRAWSRTGGVASLNGDDRGSLEDTSERFSKALAIFSLGLFCSMQLPGFKNAGVKDGFCLSEKTGGFQWAVFSACRNAGRNTFGGVTLLHSTHDHEYSVVRFEALELV